MQLWKVVTTLSSLENKPHDNKCRIMADQQHKNVSWTVHWAESKTHSVCASLALTDHEYLGKCKIVYYTQSLSIAASYMRFARARNKIWNNYNELKQGAVKSYHHQQQHMIEMMYPRTLRGNLTSHTISRVSVHKTLCWRLTSAICNCSLAIWNLQRTNR